MHIRDVGLYAPIVHSEISRDGQRLAALVPHAGTGRGRRTLQLLVLRPNSDSWSRMNHGAISVISPIFSPDAATIAALRITEDGPDAALLPIDAGDPVPLILPRWAVAMKWDGALPTCIGVDKQETRRVYQWKDSATRPGTLTPAGFQVGDYALRKGRLAWLHQSAGWPTGGAEAGGLEHRGDSGHNMGRVHTNTLHIGTAPLQRPIELPVNISGHLAWSDDARRLAFLATDPSALLSTPCLYTLEVDAWPAPSALRRLTTPDMGWPTGFDWCNDDESIRISLTLGTIGRILRLAPDGSQVTEGPVDRYLSGPKCAKEADRWIYLRQAGDEPQHIRRVENGTHKRISAFSARVRSAPLRPSNTVEWTHSDGTGVQAVYLEPASSPHTIEGPHPLIVWIHGGPAEHIEHTFSPYYQVFTEHGYAVLAPNYRGSTARGDAFLTANVASLGQGDLDDVLDGVAHLIRTGRVDATRVGAVGWSYGGTLALLGAARSNSPLKAAVVGAPVVDWVSIFGAPVLPTTTRKYFDRSPWDDRAAYDRASPITHAQQIDIPVLFVHGAQDNNVPLAQSTLMHRALKARGTHTDLRIFPGEGHVFNSPAAVRELLAQIVTWMDRHLA